MSHTETTPGRIFFRAKVQPQATAYFFYEAGRWQSDSWYQFAEKIRTAGRALLSLGVEKGNCITIIGHNSPQTTITTVATMCIGGASSRLSPAHSSEDLCTLLQHAESPLVFVEDHETWAKLHALRSQLPLLRQIISLSPTTQVDDPWSLSWPAFLACQKNTKPEAFHARLNKLAPEHVAVYSYILDANGTPKGAMLSHRNLTWTASALIQALQLQTDDALFVSSPATPLNEQIFSIDIPAASGCKIFYPGHQEPFPTDSLLEARPSLLLADGHSLRPLQEKIHHYLAELPSVQAKIHSWARSQAIKAYQQRHQGRSLNLFLQLKMAQARAVALNKLKEALGLDRIRVALTHARTLFPEELAFFASVDIPLFEYLYLTEATGFALLQLPQDSRPGSFGKALPDAIARISKDGTLALNSPQVFLGYYKDNHATKQALQKGWLLTSQHVTEDQDGFFLYT